MARAGSARLILTVLLITACSATSARYSPIGDRQPMKPVGCDIEIFWDGRPPAREHIKVARLDVHVEHMAWAPPNLDAALQELRAQACRAGADAVVDLDQVRGGHLENRRLHLSGTAIKWR